MGGDYGPHVVLEGVVQALPELLSSPGELTLLGDEKIIQPILSKRRYQPLVHALARSSSSNFRVQFVHATQTIDMEDSIRAVRSKPNATINIGCQLAAKSYHEAKTAIPQGIDPNLRSPAAFISAGHSGAIMASALLHMGRLWPVERPAIATQLPTLKKNSCVLIDAGANVDCKPEHLRDFAIMGAIYARSDRKDSSLPKVALLSNGEERKKGNELTRNSAKLIEELACFQENPHPIGQFTGYVEGKELFRGNVDVVVTDGFLGNVVLKSLEGLSAAVVETLKREGKRNPITSLGFLLSAGVFARFKRKFDYAEYGAAPLLGVAGYVFICHGRSRSKAIKNALLRARNAVRGQYVEHMEKILGITTTQSSGPQDNGGIAPIQTGGTA
jgi:glycerol-3-phosphate acyltransferase PlsX